MNKTWRHVSSSYKGWRVISLSFRYFLISLTKMEGVVICSSVSLLLTAYSGNSRLRAEFKIIADSSKLLTSEFIISDVAITIIRFNYLMRNIRKKEWNSTHIDISPHPSSPCSLRRNLELSTTRPAIELFIQEESACSFHAFPKQITCIFYSIFSELPHLDLMGDNGKRLWWTRRGSSIRRSLLTVSRLLLISRLHWGWDLRGISYCPSTINDLTITPVEIGMYWSSLWLDISDCDEQIWDWDLRSEINLEILTGQGRSSLSTPSHLHPSDCPSELSQRRRRDSRPACSEEIIDWLRGGRAYPAGETSTPVTPWSPSARFFPSLTLEGTGTSLLQRTLTTAFCKYTRLYFWLHMVIFICQFALYSERFELKD